LNTTDTVHVAAAASELVQVLAEMTKSPVFAPEIAMLVKVAVLVPVFFTVVVCAALVLPVVVTGNEKDAGVNVRVVAAAARVDEAHDAAMVKAMRRVRSAARLNDFIGMLLI
jgi:hypothetical protein